MGFKHMTSRIPRLIIQEPWIPEKFWANDVFLRSDCKLTSRNYLTQAQKIYYAREAQRAVARIIRGLK